MFPSLPSVIWIYLTVLFYVIQGVLIKYFSTKEKNAKQIAFSYVFFTLIFALFLFWDKLFFINTNYDFNILIYSILHAFAYVALAYFTVKTLETIDGSLFFSIKRLSAPILSLVFLMGFGEMLSAYKLISIILSFIALFLFLRIEMPKKGKLYALGVLGSTLACNFISKFGSSNISFFFVNTYLFATIILAILLYFEGLFKYFSLKKGVVLGLFNFLAYLSLLSALKYNPASLVFAMLSLIVAFGALVSHFLFREKLSKKKVIAIFLAFLAVLLSPW